MKERSAAYWAAIDELTVLRLRRESPAAVLAAVEREEADEVPVYDPAELAYPGSERRWCARADCGRVFWSRRPWHLYCRTACASLAGSRRYYDRWRRKRFSPRA